VGDRDGGLDRAVKIGDGQRPLLPERNRLVLEGDPRCMTDEAVAAGEPLEPPPVSPARGPPTAWGELVQVHDDRDVLQSSPDELPAIDIHSL
jgi:hypothetical protein